MKTKSAVLTREERDVLILAITHLDGKQLNNSEIAQRLGMSVSRVKTLIHQACVKMGTHNRNQAIFLAMIQGEINLNEFYSMDEVAEIGSLLGPDVLRKVAQLVRQELEHEHLRERYKQIIPTDRRQNTILTQRERDVLILAGRGLTNKEIAYILCITIGSVKIFINRACTKLGAGKRGDAVVLALKQREIGVGEVYSLNDSLQIFGPLGAENIERIAQLQSQNLGQEPVPTGS